MANPRGARGGAVADYALETVALADGARTRPELQTVLQQAHFRPVHEDAGHTVWALEPRR